MELPALASIRQRLAGWARGRRARTVLVVLLALALLWTLLAGWALPRIVKPRIEAAASEALGAPLVIEQLDFAPWSLRARVKGLRLGPADAPWLRVAEIVADGSTESLWRFAPVLERVEMTAPELQLERQQPGRFNISPLLDALARRPPAPADAKPARFALYNLRLADGRVHVVDRVAGTEHTIEALSIGVPFLSNLPSKIAIDVEPHLDATIDGSRFTVQGKTLPFQQGLRSSIEIKADAIDVHAWAEALASQFPQQVGELPIDVGSGRLDLALHADFERRDAPQPPSLRISGNATLAKFAARVERPALGVAIERVLVEGLDLRPLDGQMALARLQVQAPQVEADLARLLARAPTADDTPTPASKPAGAAPFIWSIGAVELGGGELRLTHGEWSQPRVVKLESLRAEGLASKNDAPPATLSLRAADDQGAALQIDGSIDVAKRHVAAKVDLAGVQPAAWLAPWRERLPLRVDAGRVGVQAQIDADAAAWTVREGRAIAESVELRALGVNAGDKRAGDDRLRLAKLAVDGLRLEGGADRALDARIGTVALDGLDLMATRGPARELAWLPARSETKDEAKGEAKRSPPAAAPSWRIDELTCRACAVAFSDRAVQPAALHALTRIDLSLAPLSSDLARPIAFQLDAQGGRTGRSGRIVLKGEATPQPLAVTSRVDIAALDLAGVQPYLEPYLNVVLQSAKVDAKGDLKLEGTAKEPLASARWKGSAALAELRARDKLNDAELLRFKRLRLDGSDVLWRAAPTTEAPAPLQADLGRVALEDFYGRVIINADGRINLRDILKREGGDRSLTTPNDAASAPPPAASRAPEPAAAQPASQLRWQGIRVARGEVDFTDNFIRPNYSARLTDVSGEVAALAWSDPQPAAIKLTGRVDGAAPLEIGGSIHPLGARLATDVTASARGIDITRLSGYSARYAGYGIEKGTLTMRVHYRIQNGKLEAENQLVLDQLTFGEHVDSPNALKLPLQLAVSLLKDRNGVIDVNLPVSGSLDDPQFSIGGVIVRVIVNLITKAVTAPFSLLASAFGGAGGEELGHVVFAPGSMELDEAATKRLDALAKALLDRPALKLEATGHADRAADEAALRQRHVERLMRVAKAKSLGELPDSVTLAADERERWLEAAYRAADLKTKPRNAVGFVKSLPAAEMETLLAASATIDDAALRALADGRGNRVKAELVARVPPERVLLTASKLGREGIKDDGPTPRVDFALR